MRRRAVVAVLLGLGVLAGCARQRTPSFTREPFLVVWAGDADRKHSDFLAVLDADPRSESYGKVLRTYPVRSRGNEPHRLNVDPRADGRVFAGGLLTSRTFVFDLRDPLAGRLVHTDEPDARRRFWAPHDYVTLPNGNVVVACSDPARALGEPRELLARPGGLVELTADGRFVREMSAGDPQARYLIAAPNGARASSLLRRLVTTSTGKGYAPTVRGERMPGIGVQVWRWPAVALEHTAVLPAGPRGEENLGPLVPSLFRTKPFVLVDTDEGGALYASNSVQTDTPSFRLAFDFGAGTRPGGAAVTPDDRFYVVALGGTGRVVSLDVVDPWHPRQVSSVGVGSGPHGLAMGTDGSRVAVANYTVRVPAYGKDGDARVNLVRVDPATGRLQLDSAFRDELTDEVGVSFARSSWPHGETGPARPAGMLFVTAAPPDDGRRRRDD